MLSGLLAKHEHCGGIGSSGDDGVDSGGGGDNPTHNRLPSVRPLHSQNILVKAQLMLCSLCRKDVNVILLHLEVV